MVEQMAKTASSTNTSVAQLGEGILTIGATAKSVKGGTAELNTALGILANNGIKGAKVEAIESHPGAVRSGIKNIKKSGFQNVRLHEGNALKALLKFERADVLVLDPPRTGTPGISQIVEKIDPNRIVLVFCDLESFLKDCKAILSTKKYKIEKVAGFDLYPRTHYVETVVLLSWKGIDDFMYVDYAPDHHVIQGGKTTYKESTEWIQETYGAHVTNLNIAQVKDKCGFEKRENYNKGRKDIEFQIAHQKKSR